MKNLLLALGLVSAWLISSEMDYQDSLLVAECETSEERPAQDPELSASVDMASR